HAARAARLLPYARRRGIPILRAPASLVEVARVAHCRRRPLMKDSSAAFARSLIRRPISSAVAAAFCACAALPLAAQPSRPSPFDLSLEELGTVRVQTASRRAETLNAVSAAVYVITAEEIRRSGVTSI